MDYNSFEGTFSALSERLSDIFGMAPDINKSAISGPVVAVIATQH